ncbi:hypothetical protein C8Q76DRAFT_791501 [Earliella scabrosa]|nr:hypothetical protein C8Q76DRAFT_791501 [Earliella scabrosa]
MSLKLIVPAFGELRSEDDTTGYSMQTDMVNSSRTRLANARFLQPDVPHALLSRLLFLLRSVWKNDGQTFEADVRQIRGRQGSRVSLAKRARASTFPAFVGAPTVWSDRRARRRQDRNLPQCMGSNDASLVPETQLLAARDPEIPSRRPALDYFRTVGQHSASLSARQDPSATEAVRPPLAASYRDMDIDRTKRVTHGARGAAEAPNVPFQAAHLFLPSLPPLHIVRSHNAPPAQPPRAVPMRRIILLRVGLQWRCRSSLSESRLAPHQKQR